MKIASNGIALHVEDRGTGAPAVVFLHYWGGSSRTWQHVVDLLSSDVRTIAVDQRGWGRSDKPDGLYDLANLAADIEGVVEALRLAHYVLVGHSMGGKVAQLIASRRPPGLVGLVLVAPSPPVPMNLPLDVRHGMVGAYVSRESIIATVEQVLAGSPLGADDLDSVVTDSLLGAAAAKAAWPLATSQEDIGPVVVNIAVPTLVISGEEDRVDPPAMLKHELLTRIPQARLALLPGIGHLVPLEAPGDLARLIRTFIQSLAPTTLAC
jgi:pimeloyl-ACP methyl ester carboxylesterase